MQLEEELKILAWWTDLLESGVDTQNLVREYGLLKAEHKKLIKTTEKEISRLTRALAAKTIEHEETLAKLKR